MHFFDYISLLFLALTCLQTKMTLLYQSRREFYPCCYSRGFIFHLDLPSRQNTQRTGSVLVLMAYYLSFRIQGYLSKELFVFLPLLSSGANLAVRRKANKDTGDRGKVFVCVIGVVYRTTGFSVSKRISKNEACSCFLLWPPSIS